MCSFRFPFKGIFNIIFFLDGQRHCQSIYFHCVLRGREHSKPHAQLEVLGTLKGEVLHLASLSGWTAERLAQRGLPRSARCLLWDQSEETMMHLLTGCPFAGTIWHEVLSWIRSTSTPPVDGDEFTAWWASALRATPMPCARAPRRWSFSRRGGSRSTTMQPSSIALGLLFPPYWIRPRRRPVNGLR
jgi:hypothetical protein